MKCNMHLPRTGFQYQVLDNEMARLFWGIIPVERVAALFYYEAGAESAHILYGLKYEGNEEIGLVMGRMMAKELLPTGFFDGIDLLVAIPLSRKRQRQRGYNQSLLLAQGIGEVTGLKVGHKVVRRTQFQQSQTKMDLWERRKNVEGVFQLVEGERIRGKHILLIDDVVTTGATVSACARELLQVEGVKVSILSLGFAKSM